MFTRQHYKAIADIIRDCVARGVHDCQETPAGYINPTELINKLANFFEEDNPRFDRTKWFNYLDRY